MAVGGTGVDALGAGFFNNLNSNGGTTTFGMRLSYQNYNFTPVSIGNWCAIGDSTVTNYDHGFAVTEFFGSNANLTKLATAGENITEQKTRWDNLSSEIKAGFTHVFIMVGLNNLTYQNTAASQLLVYQGLIDAIKTAAPQAKIIVATMTPCKQRLIDLYGAVDGLTSYQKWVDMNEGIRGEGDNAITGYDVCVDSHTDSLNDGSDNLDAKYNVGDNIHPNRRGREIIANAWKLAI
jgi:lysophospholipase L1-like esterase